MSNSNNSEFATGSALPFKTQDAILANCLRAAGFTESPISPLVIYDEDILFKAGGGVRDRDGKTSRPSRYAGLNIVEAARRAHKEGQRGRVEYHFDHHADLGKFCEIYADQCKEIESGPTQDAAARFSQLISKANGPALETCPDSIEILFRILCIALKLRVEFVNRWKNQTPYLVVKEQAETKSYESNGQKFQVMPGGKMVPITAPDQTFRNLGLI